MSKSTKNNDSNTAVLDAPAESTATNTPKEPTIKPTPVEERQYIISTVAKPDEKFRGKQRQAVWDVLKNATEPLTAKQVAAQVVGLVAKGGVEPSVRYHLHHLALENLATVTNPTITIE